MTDPATVPDPEPAKPNSLPATPSLDRRKSVAVGLLGISFLVVVFVRIIPQVGDYSAARTALSQLQLADLLLVLASVAVYLLWYGIPFVAAVPGLRFWAGFAVNQAAFTVSNGVPAGGAIGLAMQQRMLMFYGAAATAATAGIAAISLWSVLTTLGVPILGVLAADAVGQESGSYLSGALVGIAVLLAILTVLALLLASPATATRLAGWTQRLLAPLLRRSAPELDLVTGALKFRDQIVDLVRERWGAISMAQLGVVFWQFAILWVVLRGLDPANGSIRVGAEIFAAFAISQLGLLIPFTPGGLGTVDVVLITILARFGIDSGVATAGALVWRASSYFPQILLGLVCIGSWRVQAARRARP